MSGAVRAAARGAARALVSPLARVSGSAEVRAGASVESFAVVGDRAVVAERAAVADYAQVLDGARLGVAALVEPYAVVQRGAVLGDGSLVGARAVVEEGARVPDLAVVPPGFKVTKANAGALERRSAEEAGQEAALREEVAKANAREWSLAPHQRAVEEEERRDYYTYTTQGVHEANPGWSTFVSADPNPIRDPHRRGLIFDKR